MSKFNTGFKTSFGPKGLTKAGKPTKQDEAEEEAKEVAGKALQSIQESQRKLSQDNDTEYFICIAFQNRAQKEEFLKKKGWIRYGDKYFAAVDIAKHEGVSITIDTTMRKAFRFKGPFKAMPL